MKDMTPERPMTPAEIAELRMLCDAAMPGPYSVRHGRDQASDVYTVLDGNDMWVADCGNAPQDAAFIAAARTALPDLLDEVERLTRERDEAREECSRLLPKRSPLDPSGYSLADAEFIIESHHRGMTIEDRAESLKRIGETESAELRVALLSAERDWRNAITERDEVTADRDRLRALLGEAVEIARKHITNDNSAFTDESLDRLAALASEGGV